MNLNEGLKNNLFYPFCATCGKKVRNVSGLTIAYDMENQQRGFIIQCHNEEIRFFPRKGSSVEESLEQLAEVAAFQFDLAGWIEDGRNNGRRRLQTHSQ